MYDDEAIYQDADIEMAMYAREARAMEAARARGVCQHQSSVGLPDSGKIFYPEQRLLKRGQVACTEGCGTIFDSEDEWVRAMQEAAL